jgi:hypothetical protein
MMSSPFGEGGTKGSAISHCRASMGPYAVAKAFSPEQPLGLFWAEWLRGQDLNL